MSRLLFSIVISRSLEQKDLLMILKPSKNFVNSLKAQSGLSLLFCENFCCSKYIPKNL